MTGRQNAEIVTSFLKANKRRYFCENYLSAQTGARPVNQVNQIVRSLAASRDFRRSREPP